jgi:hypothetical protein
MYRIQLDPGPWAQYIKRADNVNLPLNEVSKKYMMESNLYATQLFEALQQQQSMQSAVAAAGAGLGTPSVTTPAPTSTPTPTPTATPTPTPTPLPGTSSIAINLCAPTSSYSGMIVYAYVSSSQANYTNTGVTASFYWSGSGNQLLSGSIYINSGSSCGSGSFNGITPGQTVVSFTHSGSINPPSYFTLSSGTYVYSTGSAITSGGCIICP